MLSGVGQQSVVLYACVCLLKDESSQACLHHAVHIINRERWSFIVGLTVTLKLPHGITVLGFVLKQTAINNVLMKFGLRSLRRAGSE